ncbi:MAG: VUT family protein, partial [Bacteroidaceae bacterium]|nr:VUT family protein [Bacteroidaceae bacterium]
YIKKKMNGKHLWIRTIGSSAIGYVFDTVPFVLIAFAGVVSTRDLLLMLAFQYFSKLIIEASMGTPLAYLAVRWVRKYVRK